MAQAESIKLTVVAINHKNLAATKVMRFVVEDMKFLQTNPNPYNPFSREDTSTYPGYPTGSQFEYPRTIGISPKDFDVYDVSQTMSDIDTLIGS